MPPVSGPRSALLLSAYHLWFSRAKYDRVCTSNWTKRAILGTVFVCCELLSVKDWNLFDHEKRLHSHERKEYNIQNPRTPWAVKKFKKKKMHCLLLTIILSSISPFIYFRIGILRTHELKTHLLRTQSSKVVPLQPRVGQNKAFTYCRGFLRSAQPVHSPAFFPTSPECFLC